MSNNTVSIVVPVYQAGRFIKSTIECVLAQTYTDWEMILVDDRSTDDGPAIIKSYDDKRIRYILMNSNDGAWRARNCGIDNAVGRYIAFLDADDLWEPDKLELELSYMKKMSAGFVFTGYEFADADGKPTNAVVRVPKTLTYREALHNTTIFTSTVLIDRNVVPDELIHMPNIKSEDTATWWNILRSGIKAYGLDINLVKYRRSAKTLSSNKLEALRRIWNLYRKNALLSVPRSCLEFVMWAVLAVKRRL